MRNLARKLRDAADEAEDQALRALLGEEGAIKEHGRALAEALGTAFSTSSSGGKDRLNQFLTSALMTEEVSGLAKRRRITLRRSRAKGQTRTGDAISTVLSNTVIEYLVHRHVNQSNEDRPRSLSFPDFLSILRERYGLFVDQAPSNMQVPSDLLQRNRRMLERRLRDLGLLTGVNDSERMKKLKPRYTAASRRIAAEAF